MKTSRKLLPLLLLICILFGCVSANADTELTFDNQTTTAQSTVVLDLGEQPTTYTIVIPSQITIDPTTGKGTGIITLKSGFVLTDITALKVRATDGYTERTSGNGFMRLNNTANDSYLDCTIEGIRNANGAAASCSIKKTTDLIAVTNQSSNDKDITAKVIITVDDDIPPYGKYTGTLTFSVVTE